MLRYIQRYCKHITSNDVIFYLFVCVNIQQDMTGMDMKSERCRLGTYSRWGHGSIQRPGDLAANGLFYTGYLDKVQCAFCHGVLKKWQKSDIPFDEHARHYPHCRFIRGLNVGNTPMHFDVHVPLYTTNHPRDQYRTISPHRMPSARIYTEPVDNDLKVEANRLKTFINWPLHLPQTPETLTDAGFYHTPCVEKPDRVQCAYCKVKLYNWLAEDDPWMTHAKNSPSCPYVKLCMGADVLNDLINQRIIQESNSCHRDENNIQSKVPSSPPPSPARRTIQDNITHHMESESVQAVLEMGFNKDLVAQTVETCLKEDDDALPSASELASMVLALEEEQASPGPAPALPQTPLQRLASRRDVPQATPQYGIMVNGTGHAIPTRTPPFQTPNSQQCVMTINGNGCINGTTQQDQMWLQYRDPAQRIREENARLSDRYLCKICMESQVRVTFLPCGHLACCGHCSTLVSLCPICRMGIESHINTYY